MVMLEIIARTGLLFSQPPVIALVALLGFFTRNEKNFACAVFLAAFTMIYNVYLKSIWQIPLPQPLEGWAFPSGHMHTAVAFWGWLAYAHRNFFFTCFVFFMLCLVGYGLIYQGYHYPADVLASVGFGCLSVFIFGRMQKLSFFQEKPYFLGVPLLLLGGICMLLMPDIKPHVWQAAGILSGFTLGWYYLAQKPTLTISNKQQIIMLCVAVAGATLIMLGTKQLPLTIHYRILLTFFTLSLWIASCKRFVRVCARCEP